MPHRAKRSGGAGAALFACALALGVCGPVAHASKVPQGRTLIIAGAGEGHGVGMSQDGALGLAEHGYSYAQILAHYYTGTALGLVPRAKKKVRVLLGNRVVAVPLERYVRGVVSAEVSPTWPMAALEAQAVASRTYALTDHAGGSSFDVYGDTRSQVYGGRTAETRRTNTAVAATAGQVVTYQGRPVITYFFASSGGMTENIEDAWPGTEAEPWLRGVQDPYEGRGHPWALRMSFAHAASLLSGLVRGRFEGIEVLQRGYSPRVVSANVLGSRGATRISGLELAERLGLVSSWVHFSVGSGGGVHAEPDRSDYTTPPPGSTPQPAPGGGAAGGASPTPPPSSEHGGSSSGLVADPGGGVSAAGG